MITLKAHAKINLTLDVTGFTDNGYHSLSMIMQSVALADTITIESISEGILFSSGSTRIPVNENNLVFKTARLFLDKMSLPHNIHIDLKKKIPVSAGLAGGSADAAAVLVGLNQHFGCGLSLDELKTIGLELGADVPFCLTGGTALCEGVGEIITKLPDMPDCYILIAKPLRGMSTPKAFAMYDEYEGALPEINNAAAINALNEGDLDTLCLHMKNKLQPVTEECVGTVEYLASKFIENGAKAASMTGSGTAVFGIFDSRIIAEKCRKRLHRPVLSYITTPSKVGVTIL